MERQGQTGAVDYDAVIVGASLAGCAAAILLGRAGVRVALVEKRPDPLAFKRICSHFIQASSIPTLERLDLLEPIMAAGAVRPRSRAWTRWGWVDPPPERAARGVNLRRERLDPLVREAAAATPGVELILGREASRLAWEGGAVAGVVVHDRAGAETTLRAPLTVGADGRDSRIAELAGVASKTLPHGRFIYGAYFEGALPDWAPDSAVWFLDPQVAAAFPTDSGLVAYAAVMTKDRLPEFRRDPIAALVELVGNVPDAPPIRAGRHVGPVLGKLEMPNRVRGPVAPGLALAGDAALATDPLFGVGCGWALQSAEWLADSVAPALRGAEPLEAGLARYRRRHRHELRGHAFFINDFATGRRLQLPERYMFAAAARDPELALTVDAYATRSIKPTRMFARVVPRAIAVNTRHALSRRRKGAPAGRS
ncbi:MAG TPA: NAD(P)/FAD-dependent oxidoreductase [Solirubrobacterales bacterium]|nr:NAD(P)/FAD-dependent oxidoreductase [Solirubrobacterales bacterium]